MRFLDLAPTKVVSVLWFEALCFVDYKNMRFFVSSTITPSNVSGRTHLTFGTFLLNVMTGPRECLGCLNLLLLLQLSGVGLPPLLAKWNTLPPTTSKSSGTRSHLHYTITSFAATQLCKVVVLHSHWLRTMEHGASIQGIYLCPQFDNIWNGIKARNIPKSLCSRQNGKMNIQLASVGVGKTASHVASKCHSKHKCCSLTKMTSPLCLE